VRTSRYLHTSAYVSLHTSAYVSIQQHTSADSATGGGFKVAIAGFDVTVARQIGGLELLPFFFREFDFLLQRDSKAVVLDFRARRRLFGAGFLLKFRYFSTES
jgi:hypothetical protein